MTQQMIYSVLDRLAHHSTTDTDLINTVAGLRRLLKGEMPSAVLRSNSSEEDRLRKKLTKRVQEIKDLRLRISELEMERGRDTSSIGPREFYSYEQVLQAMVTKFGKHHGVPAALCERNAQLRHQGQNIDIINSSALQHWRKTGCYPGFVVEQINAMSADDLLSRRKWTDSERQFLADLYNADPSRSNRVLADACSAHFNRLITECSIKGELDRLRQSGRVGRYRKGREG